MLLLLIVTNAFSRKTLIDKTLTTNKTKFAGNQKKEKGEGRSATVYLVGCMLKGNIALAVVPVALVAA